jgi:hypothetical protein
MAEMMTALPEAGVSVMEPELPFTTASLKVNTIFVDGGTLLLPRAGLYLMIVGETVSAGLSDGDPTPHTHCLVLVQPMEDVVALL